MALRASALLALALVACGLQAPAPERLDAGRLGAVELFRPRATPSAFVFLFSDARGWSPAWQQAAETLRARGAVVVGVDLPSYLAGLRESDDGCHYLIAELEALSQRLQRRLGSERYRSPILAGAGAGATLAYAALAQSPAATVAGACAAAPAAALDTRVPLCPGAASRPAPGGGFSYADRSDLPGFYRVDATGLDGDAAARAAALVLSALDAEPTALDALPLVEIPSPRPSSAMAVIYSGDGGWRDLDKTLGEILAREGVPVVGVDSLRYFWREKTPERVAADLSEIIRRFSERWQTHEVALVGYSFGAGILPFAVNRIPEAERARVAQITLLGLGPRAPFRFHVTGWLGQLGVDVDPYRDAPLVLPELLRIDPRLVQCVYGEQEADTLCTDPSLAGTEVIRTTGSHHFDGDYPALAQRILDGLRRRTRASGGSGA